MEIESTGAVNSGYRPPEPPEEVEAAAQPVEEAMGATAPLEDEQGRNIDFFA